MHILSVIFEEGKHFEYKQEPNLNREIATASGHNIAPIIVASGKTIGVKTIILALNKVRRILLFASPPY